jgi:hypothetical protein
MKPRSTEYPGEHIFREKITKKAGEVELNKFLGKMKKAGFIFIECEPNLTLHFEMCFPIKEKDGIHEYRVVHIYISSNLKRVVKTDWLELFQGEIQEDGNFEHKEKKIKEDEVPHELITKLENKFKEVGLIL